jgi:hypothetical protein
MACLNSYVEINIFNLVDVLGALGISSVNESNLSAFL